MSGRGEKLVVELSRPYDDKLVGMLRGILEHQGFVWQSQGQNPFNESETFYFYRFPADKPK